MPNTFPDVPFDESLFEANELMREYWQRSTENRAISSVPDTTVEETLLVSELLQLQEMSKNTFERQLQKEEVQQVVNMPEPEVQNEEIHVVNVPLEIPSHEAIVKTLTVNQNSGLSAGAVVAIIIITIIVLYLIIVGLVPYFTGTMRD